MVTEIVMENLRVTVASISKENVMFLECCFLRNGGFIEIWSKSAEAQQEL